MKSILESIRTRQEGRQVSTAGASRPDASRDGDAAIASGVVELVDMLASVRIELGSIAARAHAAVEPAELQRALAELDHAIRAIKELAGRVDPTAGPQREKHA